LNKKPNLISINLRRQTFVFLLLDFGLSILLSSNLISNNRLYPYLEIHPRIPIFENLSQVYQDLFVDYYIFY